jgi:DNA-binding response OmpR family regulator/DNA-binding CsgD family transcriptional regulator
MNATRPLSGARLLIVDDVPANLTLLHDLLQEAGAKVFVAEDGLGALEQLAHAQPELVLLDVMMPGIDGFETCRRLKALPGHAATPVIFMSALTDTVDKVRGFEAGAADYVTKPLHPAEVLARLQAHLAVHRLQRELRAEVKLRAAAEQQLRLSLDRAVVVAGGEGEILFATRRAEELLAAYFPRQTLGVLPAAFGAVQPEGFARPGGGGLRLTARRFVEQGAAACYTLLLEEAGHAAVPQQLQVLGLTVREAEILFWVAQGKANFEVAVILGTAPNTIKKHLQNIMPKLGVENRLAAALRAGEILNRRE